MKNIHKLELIARARNAGFQVRQMTRRFDTPCYIVTPEGKSVYVGTLNIYIEDDRKRQTNAQGAADYLGIGGAK